MDLDKTTTLAISIALIVIGLFMYFTLGRRNGILSGFIPLVLLASGAGLLVYSIYRIIFL